jgi:hypothetical protein
MDEIGLALVRKPMRQVTSDSDLEAMDHHGQVISNFGLESLAFADDASEVKQGSSS